MTVVRMVNRTKFRWLAFMIITICAVSSNIDKASNVPNVEFLVYELNSPYYICYYLMFGIILLKGDINTKEYNLRVYNSFGLRSILVDTLSSGLLIVFLSIVSIVLVNIITNRTFVFQPEQFQIDSINYLTTSSAIVLSIILIYSRCLVCLLTVCVLNNSRNLSIGFTVLLFTFIDRWLYEIFDIAQPLGITLLEHSTIFYCEAVAPASKSAVRIPFFLSFAIWMILIAILIAILTIELKSWKRDVDSESKL